MNMNLRFVKYFNGKDKKGQPFEILELSNGLRSATFSMSRNVDRDFLTTLTEGEEVDVEMEANPFDAFRPFKVNSIDRA